MQWSTGAAMHSTNEPINPPWTSKLIASAASAGPGDRELRRWRAHWTGGHSTYNYAAHLWREGNRSAEQVDTRHFWQKRYLGS
jgi:hypothetical protein